MWMALFEFFNSWTNRFQGSQVQFECSDFAVGFGHDFSCGFFAFVLISTCNDNLSSCGFVNELNRKISKNPKKIQGFFEDLKSVHLIWEWTTPRIQWLNPFLFIKSSYTQKNQEKNSKKSEKFNESKDFFWGFKIRNCIWEFEQPLDLFLTLNLNSIRWLFQETSDWSEWKLVDVAQRQVRAVQSPPYFSSMLRRIRGSAFSENNWCNSEKSGKTQIRRFPFFCPSSWPATENKCPAL